MKIRYFWAVEAAAAFGTAYATVNYTVMPVQDVAAWTMIITTLTGILYIYHAESLRERRARKFRRKIKKIRSRERIRWVELGGLSIPIMGRES